MICRNCQTEIADVVSACPYCTVNTETWEFERSSLPPVPDTPETIVNPDLESPQPEVPQNVSKRKPLFG